MSLRGLAIGAVFGFGAALLGFGLGSVDATALEGLKDRISPIGAIALAAIAVPLPLLLHEVGHALAGALVGFRFVLLAIGPLLVERGPRVRLHGDLSLYGGLAAMAPRDGDDLVRKMAWTTAGGPLASLATTLGGLALFLTRRESVPEASFFGLVLSISALLNFLAVVVPRTTGGFLSDRGRLQVLLGGGEPARICAASGRLLALELDGVRPRDWPRDELDVLRAANGTSLDELVGRLGFLVPYAEDAGDLAGAQAELDAVLRAYGDLPSSLRAGVLIESAFLAAMARGDGDQARAQLDRAGKAALVEPYLRSRAEAATLQAEGDHESARSTAERGLAELDRATPTGSVQMVRDQLEALVAGDSSQSSSTG
ncbi:MAG: hypothetical protein AAF726_12520 [Planctomycetota bacterium]